jgi:pimeloyl-ACP methyl ester carboxylesterase
MARTPSVDLPADHTLELADGRTLGYLDLGHPAGVPVVSNHGGLSSRLDVAPAHAAAVRHGLRIISPDRPGIGLSSPLAGRTLADWPADVAALADHLDLDRFATIGWSFGGCFAQSVAHQLADRVSALVLVASGIPRDWSGMRDDIDRMDRVFLRLSEHAVGRAADRTIFHLMGAVARHAPAAFARSTGYDGPDAATLVAAIAEGLSDRAGVLRDYEILDSPWGFDPSDITVPTQIWQGDADELVPPDWGRRLHDAIAGSSLTVVPGATHYLWYEHWDDLFAGITSLD